MFTTAQMTVTDDVAGTIADRVARELRQAVAERQRASLVLAGGSTYQKAYRQLALLPLEWSQIDVFFGDERQVDHADPFSNYRMAADQLAGVWVAQNVHPLDDSQEYDDLIAEYLDKQGIFDITLLGLGPDGHTASLFPGCRTLWESTGKLVVDTEAGLEPFVPRRSLTPEALDRSRLVIVAATGKTKADIVAKIVGDAETYPVSLVNPQGEKLLILDSEAAEF